VNVFKKNRNRVGLVVYEAEGHMGLLKMTFGWFFGSGNLVSLAL